jgi:hypothetical protein
LRDAEIIDRWKGRPFGERRDFLIEKKIFTSAYVMRKLMESLKLSSDLSRYDIPCKTYPCIKRPTVRDRWEWYEHYDMERASPGSISAPALYNLIIHSLIFTESVTGEGHSVGFLITSDSRRGDALGEVEFRQYIDLIRRVAEDNPSHVSMRYDWSKEDWVVWRGNEAPPENL